MKMGTELLKDIYARTEVFCANKEEYELILNMKGANVKEMMDKMQELGPKIVLLSDGPHGAYMKADGKYYSVPLYPDIAPPLERTGAGDAFASTFVSYLAKGMNAEESLLRAPINSMNVNQHVGAQEGLLEGDKIEEYLKNAPSEYKLMEI
jgi:sugar/nucleoside kinase (ribokinase family)